MGLNWITGYVRLATGPGGLTPIWILAPVAVRIFGLLQKDFRPPNMAGEAAFRLPKLAPERETFVSVWQFRPPKVLPNMHEFHLWREPSAAESAAEAGGE